MSDDRKACEGADIIVVQRTEEMHECIACGMMVRWDMTDHPFFGFTVSCPMKSKVERGK